MREIEKCGEAFVEDELTLRLCYPKKWNAMTKGDIQEILNKYIEDWVKNREASLDDDYIPFLDKCGEQYIPVPN